MDPPSCESCKQLYTLRAFRMSEVEPPCGTCKPQIMYENREALFIWGVIRNQVDRAGMAGEIVGLRHEPLWKAIEMYRIKSPVDCFEKVIKIFYDVQMEHKE